MKTMMAPSSTRSASAGSSAAPAPRPVRIGDLLLEKGIINQQQLDQALEHQKSIGHKKLLGEVLVELKLVAEEQVQEVLAEAYGVPFARVSPKIADPKIIEVLPR